MPVPEWISDAELDVWLSIMGETLRLVGHLDERLVHEHGISYAEFRTLISIARDGPQRMSDLAQDGMVSRSGISRQVARLVDLGHVEQFTDTSDGRTRFVRLTEQGLDLVTKASSNHFARIREHVFDQLEGGEMQVLSTVFGKVGASLTHALQ